MADRLRGKVALVNRFTRMVTAQYAPTGMREISTGHHSARHLNDGSAA
jgi:hypothetical protein